jgi:uncharacterized membrane protein
MNFLAIVLATAVQFICGGVWYSFLFGKLWGRIHGFDKLSKSVQQKMMSEMGVYYVAQLVVTVITSVVLSVFITNLPSGISPFVMTGLLWLGFVVPAQVSAVIFGGTDKQWIVKKIAVQAGASFACLQLATAVLSAF